MNFARILNGFCSHSQYILIAFSMELVAFSMGLERILKPFRNDSQWIDFEMLLIRFPIDRLSIEFGMTFYGVHIEFDVARRIPR